MLEHQRQEGAERPSGGPRLTQEELAELLNEAIRQGGQAALRQDQVSQLATLDDALAIAREAGIAEEHVQAAASELQRRKLRGRRREIVRARRRTAFFGWLAIAVVVGLIAALFSSWLGAVATLLLTGLPALFLAWKWLLTPVTDEEADRVELPPDPGVCRVCGRPAYSPRATFCEEHRYRGPGRD